MSCEGKYRIKDCSKPLINHVQQETTVGQRLSAIFSDHHHMEPPMSRDDCYAATHPSEHNSVFIIGRSGRGRNQRQTEWERRREKEGEKIGKGKRAGKESEIEGYLRGRDHGFPFLSPVPKTHGYGCPHAHQSYTLACAVVCPPPAFPTSSCDPSARTESRASLDVLHARNDSKVVDGMFVRSTLDDRRMIWYSRLQ